MSNLSVVKFPFVSLGVTLNVQDNLIKHLMFYTVCVWCYNKIEVIDMETISFRLEDKEKSELKEVFDEMGLDISTGMRLYVKRVLATRSIPFELKVVNTIEQSLSEYERGEVTKVNNVADLMASLNEED